MQAPPIDWMALSPLVALAGGLCLVLLAGLLRAPFVRHTLVPLLDARDARRRRRPARSRPGATTSSIVSGALAMDDLTRMLTLIFLVTAAGAVLLSWRGLAPREAGHGEYHCLLLSAVLGMVLLAGASNLVTLFIGFELLSIPLYVLCATEMRRATSLESGLKYLIIGSVGSATLLYGLALSTARRARPASTRSPPRSGARRRRRAAAHRHRAGGHGAGLQGLRRAVPPVDAGRLRGRADARDRLHGRGHQGGRLRHPHPPLRRRADRRVDHVGAGLAALAVITIVVGNVGAIGQSSLKRMLAYSSVAQAGYMLAGVVVTTQLGVRAVVFYLAVYMLMNLAAFAVIIARERESGLGDDISSLYGLGADRPLLAWPMTIAMLSLAGLPGHRGLLRQDLPDRRRRGQRLRLARRGDRDRLGDLARLLPARGRRRLDALARRGGRARRRSARPRRGRRSRAARRRPTKTRAPWPRARASPAGRARPTAAPARGRRAWRCVCAAATIAFGIYPEPLLDLANDAGAASPGLF